MRKNLDRPYEGVTYTTTAKNFVVVMETSKTNIFELTSLRGIQKYIICLCYEKKNFVRANVGTLCYNIHSFFGGLPKMAWKIFYYIMWCCRLNLLILFNFDY